MTFHSRHLTTAQQHGQTHQQVLFCKVRNQALWRCLHGITPINATVKSAAVQLFGQGKYRQITVQVGKIKSLSNHPMNEKLNGLTKNRLKRSSVIHECKRFVREHKGDLPQAILLLSPADLPQMSCRIQSPNQDRNPSRHPWRPPRIHHQAVPVEG